MAKQADIEIELESGKKLTHYTAIVIEQDIHQHHTFEILVPFEMLEDTGEIFFNKSYKEVVGKTVKISVKPQESSTSGSFNFKGIVSGIVLKNNDSLSNSFSIKGYSLDILLKDGKQKRAFVEQSLKQIMEKVLNVYPQNLLKRKVMIQEDKEIAYTVQYDESNFDFLKRLANENGLWFYNNGSEMVIGQPEQESVDFEVNGIQTFDMSISLQPLEFNMSRYNYLIHEELTGKSKDQTLNGQHQLLSFALEESGNLFTQDTEVFTGRSFEDESEIADVIRLRKSSESGNLVYFNGSGENMDIYLGKIAAAKGTIFNENGNSRENFGKYRVIKIIHKVDENGNYSNQFSAIPDSIDYPPNNLSIKTPVGQVEIAEVIDNNDPEELGRVKVKFYWNTQDSESNWVRTTTPYSGVGKGMAFIPEEGAQVLVAYEFNNPSQPIVTGSLYHKGSNQSYTSEDNNKKVMQTRGGNRIAFDDKEDEQSISISNENCSKTSINISFKDNGCVEIKTEGKLSIEAKDITMKSETLEMKVDKTIEIEAGQKAHIKTAELRIKADVSAEIFSLGAAKLEAANLDISGQALVNVKGGIIKLN